MEVKIQEGVSCGDKINPDVIYNRCDLWADKYALVSIFDSNKEYNFFISIGSKEIYLGIWLMDIPNSYLSATIKDLFNNYPHVKTIKYEYGMASYGYVIHQNHFKIYLPNSEDELQARLSKKGRYNIKREKNIIIKTFGQLNVEEYSSNTCPDTVIKTYFRLKKATHNVDYHMTPMDYLKAYHVSHIYVLRIGQEIGALLFSCEQCQVVYIENLTYDLKYSKYSCGQVLYDIFLNILINKGYKEIFLAGGNLDYKKRYGSIEEKAYSCLIFKRKSDYYLHSFLEKLRSIKWKYARYVNIIKAKLSSKK